MKIKKNNFLTKARLACVIFMSSVFTITIANAANIYVSNIAELQTAANSAVPGTVIILANGTYLNNTLNLSGNKYTVMPVTPGGVFLNGTNDINITGSSITFSGFQFTSGDIGTSYLIEVYGSNNVLSHLNFSNYYAKKYIEIKAGTQNNEISYCNLEKKPAAAIIGCTIQISTSATVPGYHKIRYCSFQNYYGIGGDNGNEPIRIGLGAEALNPSRTVVEFCLFSNTGDGDSESVSVKSQENTIRYCTFKNQQNAMLCFRNGNNNVAYGNFFINAGGIRVKEANNIYCYNNYFENSGTSTGNNAADAVTYVYYTASSTNVLNNINFINNTFNNCGYIDLGGTGAINNTWANNIFKKSSGAGSLFKNANAGTTWAGNMYQGSLGISIPSGMSNINSSLTLLTPNSEGYFGLSSSSPAIDASNSNYPSILDITNIDDDPSLLLDISGQSRPSIVTQKDVGCDEYTTGITTNHPLALSEVGPSYLVILPVKMVSFKVTPKNNAALLSWTTSFEQDNSHFNIERSSDGKNYYDIGKRSATNLSTFPVNYTFVDEAPLNGINYYRLKQVDLDEKFQYSDVRILSLEQSNSIKVFPNPAKNNIQFRFSSNPKSPVYIELLNLNGEKVKEAVIQALNGTVQNNLSLDITDVKSGTYFAKVLLNNKSSVVKIIVQK